MCAKWPERPMDHRVARQDVLLTGLRRWWDSMQRIVEGTFEGVERVVRRRVNRSLFMFVLGCMMNTMPKK